jgi:predicted ArsR family transcriptional regulator
MEVKHMDTYGLSATTESCAGRVIHMLAGRGPMTVRELVGVLGVTTTAVREQVNRLHADGWLVRTRRRGRTGRPADVFAVSEKVDRLFAGQVDELARLLIDELFARCGAEKSRELLQGVGQRMTRSARAYVGSGPAADRLQRLGRRLAQQGDLIETGQTLEGLRLTLHRCPFGSLADQHDEICAMERETLGDLIGAPVRLEKSWAKGQRRCEFTFSPTPSDADTTPSTERRQTHVDRA